MVVANHITGDAYWRCLRRERPSYLSWIVVLLEKTRGSSGGLAFVLWYWSSARRSQLITVISESTKRELRRYLSFQKRRCGWFIALFRTCFGLPQGGLILPSRSSSRSTKPNRTRTRRSSDLLESRAIPA